ncbi:hypothetical protein R5R35_006534 [Gryllus longicercus]|uniref:Uncharacterized protein n=1 Tax=Gryllus longicercus TaxID=2509291 RepID=A0AAN9YXX1_9ORTH
MEEHMKRKPRRIRGTPALRFINCVCLGTLGIGTAIGVSLVIWDRAWAFNQKVIEKFRFSEEHKRKQFALSKMAMKVRQKDLQTTKDEE